MNFERLASISLVSELFRQSLDDVIEAILQCLVHLVKVSLSIERVLHLLHPFGELVTKVRQLHLKVIDTTNESIESFLANTATVALRNLKVGKGVGEAEELFLKGRNPHLQVLERLVLEVFELSLLTFKLMLELFTHLVHLGVKHILTFLNLLIGVVSHLEAKSFQVLSNLRLVAIEVSAH